MRRAAYKNVKCRNPRRAVRLPREGVDEEEQVVGLGLPNKKIVDIRLG